MPRPGVVTAIRSRGGRSQRERPQRLDGPDRCRGEQPSVAALEQAGAFEPGGGRLELRAGELELGRELGGVPPVRRTGSGFRG
jgi:hypothetical protein